MFVRHKSIHVDPQLVAQQGIDVYRAVQGEGCMIITFPRSYHCGYNAGVNVAEAVNFAHPTWMEYGVKHRRCECELKHHYDYNVDVELFKRFLDLL